MAPAFVELAIQEALTYDKTTREGGPNGSLVRKLAASSASASTSLGVAARVLVDIRASLLRTTEITLADVVCLAGSEAIEALGGPRVAVQLGKLDPKATTTTTAEISQLTVLTDGRDILQAFDRAGLTPREAALMFGAVGAMKQVVASLSPKQDDNVDEEEVNEMGDTPAIIPSSFGGPREIYGKQLGQMDSSIFKTIVSDIKASRASSLWTDEIMTGWVQKYAKSGFLKDLPEAYSRLMGVGTIYTGGKVGSLIGPGENDF